MPHARNEQHLSKLAREDIVISRDLLFLLIQPVEINISQELGGG